MKALNHLLFVGLSTIITVFFSEKAFWYVQGYAYGELLLYYGLVVYTCLWVIVAFRVRHLSALVLVAALYAFLVEGVLTPVLYEVGLFDPMMPAYFVGWHGLLSVVFGWYALRRWLVRGQWRRVLIVGLFFGLFWGLWSLTYALPEMSEGHVRPAPWSTRDFALYAFVFTATLALSHWLLGRGAWLRAFKPGKLEKGFLVLSLVGLFVLTIVPIYPLAILKLAVLLGIIFLALRAQPHETSESVLASLSGPVKELHVLTLFAMPVAATTVYALATRSPLPEAFLRAWLLEGFTILQSLIGAGLFLWAVVISFLRGWRSLETA